MVELIQKNIEQTQIQKEEQTIKINGKILSKNFMVSMPTTSIDFEILCDILNPNFISNEIEEYGNKDYIAGICYGLDRYDTIMKEFIKNKAQTRLIDGKSVMFMLEYFDKTKLRLIEPESEKLRLASKNSLPFLHLLKVPKYLEEYIKQRKISDDSDINYITFWENLFKEDESRKKTIAHLISWTYEKEVTERKSDKFLPIIPYIKLNLTRDIKDNLLFYTKEINRISYELYGDYSAFYFVIDADLFIDKKSIEQINTMILECPNKFIFFKILHTERIFSNQFGYYGKKNLEEFLINLLSIKENYQDKVIGMLNGSGFSYSLLNITLNFFTDTVNNFPTEGMPKYTGRHRSLMHPISLSPERIEGVLQQLDLHKALFLNDTIAQKYKGLDSQSFLKTISLDEWSKDARKMGLILWERLISARLSTDKNKVFDEVINSNFSILGTLIKKITSRI